MNEKENSKLLMEFHESIKEISLNTDDDELSSLLLDIQLKIITAIGMIHKVKIEG